MPGFYAAILGPTVVSIQCRITLQSDEHIIDKGENVSKKEKTVAVSVKDIERNGQPVEQIFVGKRLIGEVVADKERFKAILLKGEQAFYVRSQEEGLDQHHASSSIAINLVYHWDDHDYRYHAV